MIYHFVSAKYVHLSPNVIRSTIKCANLTNKRGIQDICFIIENTSGTIFNNVDNIKIYEDLAKEIGFDNIEIINNKFLFLYRVLNISKKDKIFFHSSQNARVMMVMNTILYLLRMRKKAKSLNYICWGTDFGYCTKINKVKSLINKFKAKVYETVWPWYGNIITLDKSDKRKVEEAYNSTNVIYIPYINTRPIKPIEKPKSPIRIMVSHSGWHQNKHLESFKILEKFRDDDIEVMCPLCYGESEYIQKVIDTGKEIFGNKFKYFTELMSPQDYDEFISKNHIYITATETQNGLGAISRSIEGNVKVFLKNFYYEQFSDMGYKVYRFEDIANLTFKDLKIPLDTTNIKIVEKIKKETFELTIKKWKTVYEES